jgi:hypothetical protein
VNFGRLEVTLSGPESLVAEDFVKSVSDPTTYMGFVTMNINNVKRGHYEVEWIVYYASTGPNNREVFSPRESAGIDL